MPASARAAGWPGARLTVCTAAALALHAAVLALLLLRPVRQAVPPLAVPVELVVAASPAPAGEVPPAPPAPPDAGPTPASPPIPDAAPLEPSPSAPSSELPPPQPSPPQPPPPEPVVPEPPRPEAPQPAARLPEPRTAAVPRPRPPGHAQPQPRPAPPGRPSPARSQDQPLPSPPASQPVAPPPPPPSPVAPAADPGAVAAWQGRLVGQLQRAKHYPEAARTAGEEGVAVVSFTLDRTGSVLSVRLLRSSGSAAFDEEAVALVHRAEPLPPPPGAMGGGPVTLTIPIRFSLR